MKCVRTPLMTPNCVLQDFDKKTNHFYKQLISSALIVFTICLATKQSPMTSVEQGVLSVSHPHKGIPQKPGQPCYWGQCPDNGGKWRETRRTVSNTRNTHRDPIDGIFYVLTVCLLLCS